MSTHCPHCGASLPAVADPFCPECRQPLDEAPAASEAITPASKLARLPSFKATPAEGLSLDRLAWLEERVEKLERRLRQTSLHSDSFLARAFTVWGHYFVACLIIAIPFLMLRTCAGLMGR